MLPKRRLWPNKGLEWESKAWTREPHTKLDRHSQVDIRRTVSVALNVKIFELVYSLSAVAVTRSGCFPLFDGHVAEMQEQRSNFQRRCCFETRPLACWDIQMRYRKAVLEKDGSQDELKTVTDFLGCPPKKNAFYKELCIA
jgi:hypothetical protein